MNTELIKLFEKVNKRFLREQKDFILSGVSERSICGQLMLYLYLEKSNTTFSSYYVDIEYNRNEGGKVKTIKNSEEKVLNVTCDIILHSRGLNEQQDNLIAIEMKKSNQPNKDKDNDRERLMALTKDPDDNIYSYDGKVLPENVCGYILGIFYEVNINRKYVNIEYYQKGKFLKRYKLNF
ncbi:hypothetical protein GH866_22505 [Bacillus thuringiensis]|nr:hypothetical protein [Bacillus thuringiensis]